MKSEIKELFSSIPGIDEQSAKIWNELLELPDEQFDAVYPAMKEKLEEVYKSEDVQEKTINNLKLYPETDLIMLQEAVNSVMDMIYSDDSLSNNKKEMIGITFQSTVDIINDVVDSLRVNVPVKIVKLNPDAVIPEYAHPTDAGADVSAVEETKIEAGETKIVKTGIAVAIPAGYEIQIRPRSGLSLKSKLRIANAPGTIDTEYRGEIGIIMTNTGDTPYVIEKGMKIAQMVIAPTPKIKWEEVATVEELGTTNRGADGFGSTDKKNASAPTE